jgi:outer membrane protein assembly factor BamB
MSCHLLGDDWPQWLGPQRDGVWRESGIVEELPAGGPPVVWRSPVGGGYAGPAVAGGRAYVTDRQLGAGASNPANQFDRSSIPGTERVLCLNEANGQVLWQHQYPCRYTLSYPAGPRCTPLVAQGKVYTLGAEGNLFCLEAASGKVIWSQDFKTQYQARTPMWGFAGHPLLDGRKLICLAGGENSVVVALDKDTGQLIWKALQAKEPGYCPPTIYEAGGQRQLILWHPESVNALEVETGRLLWSIPWSIKAGLTISTPRQRGDRLFLTAFYNGSLMLQLDAAKPGASVLWQSKKSSETDTTELHSIISTPFWEGDHIYGVCSYAQLRCLKADTGERVWETFAATTGKQVRWGNAFLIKQGSRFFLFNELGDLIIARLTPGGYAETSRAHLLEPTGTASGRNVLWSHPAFANRRLYARNDKEIICVSLAATP